MKIMPVIYSPEIRFVTWAMSIKYFVNLGMTIIQSPAIILWKGELRPVFKSTMNQRHSPKIASINAFNFLLLLSHLLLPFNYY